MSSKKRGRRRHPVKKRAAAKSTRIVRRADPQAASVLHKAPTGIPGFDAVTLGGLPRGRTSLICGSPGCGKTLFGMTFLVKGAIDLGEPGVLMSFEETETELATNVASLGFDVEALIASGKLAIDYVRIERREIEETGEYDLEGLFVRLGHAIDTTGAKRVVLDTVEALFAGLDNQATLRAELRRLFGWLKARGVTSIVTAERGEGQLTRHGLEEYVSDCVILLDNRVEDQITTRRLRVVKYRGSAHGTDEYPFLIDQSGISVLPITAAGLTHAISDEVVSSGIGGIDHMLHPGGFYRGSSVLLSGAAGTGKTVFASHFVNAACGRGERCAYFAFEESPDQILRNLRSVGLELRPHVQAGLLRFDAARPSLYGFEMHLTLMNRLIQEFNPACVVVDPISAFRGQKAEVHALLLRLVDLLKSRGVTALLTNLTHPGNVVDQLDHGLSSLMDTWISLTDIEENGERNRGLYTIKSRGMSHSNQIREYLITSHGIELIPPYVGALGVLTGSARLSREAEEKAAELRHRQQTEQRRRIFEAKRASVERQIAELRSTLEAESAELDIESAEIHAREARLGADRSEMASRRWSDT